MMRQQFPITLTAVMVQITHPLHNTPHYQWDGAAGRWRFAGIAPGLAGDGVGDLGVTVTAPRVPVLVLGLGSISLAPDTLIACQLMYGARDATGRLAIVACMAEQLISDAITDERIEASLIRGAQLVEPLNWLDHDTTLAALRAAQAEARRMTHAQEQAAILPAWRVPAGVDISRATIDGLGIFDAVPVLLEYIPSRFQRYLADHLGDEERVLFFAERPQSETSFKSWLARTRPILAGLLLVTDQRILFIEDRAPPDVLLDKGSYQVTVASPGRLAGVDLCPSRFPGYQTLSLTLEASGGQVSYCIDLPDTLASASEVAMQLIQGWLPQKMGRSDRRLRRVFAEESIRHLTPLHDAAKYIDQLLPEATRRLLAEALSNALKGQIAIAQARTPAMSDGPAQAVALTHNGLYVVTERHGQITVRNIDLAAIARATYTSSLATCELTLLTPQSEGSQREHLVFAHIARPLYQRIFTALSFLLLTPFPALPHTREDLHG